MNLDGVRAVADAVLWEGYLLYPYRFSADKNRIRWQFGVLGPPDSAGTGEEPALHVECLLQADAATTVEIRVRFLQLVRRQVLAVPAGADPADGTPVDELRIGDRTFVPFDEAAACELTFGPWRSTQLQAGIGCPIAVPGAVEHEVIGAAGADGTDGGVLVRRRAALTARLDVRTEPLPADEPPDWCRLRIDVQNLHPDAVADRDAASAVSLLGAHLILVAGGGVFGSLLEPPDGLADAAAGCSQRRCWPVLAGPGAGPGRSPVVLASPIILYDHPAIAPESAGTLFDATEIDEILTLRVMTMTEEEKRAARATDPAAAAIIDRCDGMSQQDLERLHGTLRDPRFGSGTPVESRAAPPDRRVPPDLSEIPTFGSSDGEKPWWDPAVDSAVAPETDTALVDGLEVGRDSIVRIRPRRRADAQDLFYAGQLARVTAVLADVDGGCHVAVVLVDDPAAELHEWYGRYLYFGPDELEPVELVQSLEEGIRE